MSQALRFIRNSLRRLRKRFGLPITVCNITGTAVDWDTGDETRTIETVEIKRALVLSGRRMSETKYDVSYIVSARHFMEGGEYDVVDRVIVLDPNDLGSLVMTTSSYIVYSGEKYEVLDTEKFENGMAIIAPCKRTVGEPFLNIHSRTVHQQVSLSQEVENA